jgi:hypothetical protein
MPSRESLKLSELRAKTDRQLLNLIDKRLHSGFEAARRLAEVDPRLDADDMIEAQSRAEKAYEEASLWLPTVDAHYEESRSRLRARLSQLRRLLDKLASHGAVHAACL